MDKIRCKMGTGVELKLEYLTEHAEYSRIRVYIRHVHDDVIKNCHSLDRIFKERGVVRYTALVLPFPVVDGFTSETYTINVFRVALCKSLCCCTRMQRQSSFDRPLLFWWYRIRRERWRMFRAGSFLRLFVPYMWTPFVELPKGSKV